MAKRDFYFGRRRRRESPPRVRGGHRLNRSPESLRDTWYGRRWEGTMVSMFDEAQLADGRSYAQAGQATRFEVAPGAITAAVQGRQRAAYATSLVVRRFDDAQWNRLIDALADRAIHEASIATGQLSEAIRELCQSLDLALVPGEAEVTATCNCAFKGACKHGAVLALLFWQHLFREPLDVFVLRGLQPSELLDRVRRQRAVRLRGFASTFAAPHLQAVEAPPLEDLVDRYWEMGPIGDRDDRPDAPEHVSHALLRRLGPSPLTGTFPIVGLLASVYDEVAREARQWRERDSSAEDVRQDDRRADST